MIEINPEVVHIRNTQGRLAIHIASEYGHTDIVALLREIMKNLGKDPIGADASVDLIGMTPLGCAMSSNKLSAVERLLYSSDDRSIRGEYITPTSRMGGDRKITYAFAEMKGMRSQMEDAMCHHYPIKLSKGHTVAFFGVFDGHDDGGTASSFVSGNIAEYFIQDYGEKPSNADDLNDMLIAALTNACMNADEERRNVSERAGRSTGVMAVITEDDIIVAKGSYVELGLII
jgi:ankyrin repeat protein